MHAHSGHPDDETLFDLIEGRLDPARTREVEAHLESCDMCGSLVRAAIAGSPDDTSPIEPMPADAVVALHARVREGWRERVEHLAAAEAASDAAAAAAAGPAGALDEPVAAPLAAPIPGPAERVPATPRASRPRRAWTRRAVPALAFVVLATLAGTSIVLDDPSDRVGGSGSAADSAIEQDGAVSGDASTVGDSVSGGAAPAAATAGGDLDEAGREAATSPQAGAPPVEDDGIPITGDVEPEADASGVADGAGAVGAAADAAAETPPVQSGKSSTAVSGTVTPPVGYDELIQQGSVCVVAFDESSIALPEGRIPLRIDRGPFGWFVVCG